VYDFVTAEGRPIRFDEAGGSPMTVVGDTVTVRYPSGRPDRATAIPPSHGRALVESGVILAFLGVMVAGCATFMVFYETQGRHGSSESTQPDFPDVSPPPDLRMGFPELP
jgi:hypothetical protein